MGDLLFFSIIFIKGELSVICGQISFGPDLTGQKLKMHNVVVYAIKDCFYGIQSLIKEFGLSYRLCIDFDPERLINLEKTNVEYKHVINKELVEKITAMNIDIICSNVVTDMDYLVKGKEEEKIDFICW